MPFVMPLGQTPRDPVRLDPTTTGTNVDDADARGSNAQDGNTNQAIAVAAVGDGLSNLNVGKDWGIGVTRKITGYKSWGSNDEGYHQNTDGTVTIKLYGSNTAFLSGGVELDSDSFTDSNSLERDNSNVIPVPATAYRWHWIEVSDAPATERAILAEVEFYEYVP